ncbi:MAG: alpha-galactosidase, partial [Firmicutes bacterium]|nr:alpha-galactosidase [Bacillota bacterium]
MGICFDKDRKIFTIDTQNSTYQFMVDGYGYLLHLYYGSKINGSAEYLLQYLDRGFSGSPFNVGNERTYSMDVLPREMPVWGNGDFRSPSLVVETESGARGAVFMYASHEIRKGKYELPGLPAVYTDDAKECGAETLEILLKDPVLGLEMRMLYGVLPELDVITRAFTIRNAGGSKVYLEKALSASIDFITGEYDLITFNGRHMMERNVHRAQIEEIGQVVGSRRGTSSHQYNPFIIVADRSAGESTGDCYAMELVYSGGFQAEAEKDQFGTTRVQMGIQEAGFHYPVAPGETFVTPEAVLAYSGEGTDGLSLKLHDLIRNHICRDPYKGLPKPVVVNSWEGAYMDINRDFLVNLAKDARELGIDMLVVDDGWFGKRNDDNSSLGDWVANESKLGCSLGELIEDVNKEGLMFGLWMEPEMVSEDSDLYRAHPDWALKLPGRSPVRSRNQLVLDLANCRVKEYVLESICRVLDSGNIEYIKWDFNRSIYEAYSSDADHQGRVLHDYVLGLYE